MVLWYWVFDMDIVITPAYLQGQLSVISSKSQLHRYLICAAFADGPTRLNCKGIGADIGATIRCLQALGATIEQAEDGITVQPIEKIPDKALLNCGESGSTLRFLLPVVGALGVDATFVMSGRLPSRPIAPLWAEMERMGCYLTCVGENAIRCQGKLRSGVYSIDGSVSSQFVTGLLLALSLLKEESQLNVTGKVESRPYIQLTVQALRKFGIGTERLGGQTFRSPGSLDVEGDWSSGAFFLTANALGCAVDMQGLDPASAQADRAVLEALRSLENGMATIHAADIPDLVPILSVAAACKQGAVFTGISRLRLKESDRVASVCSMLRALGCQAQAAEDSLTVYPGRITGGTVDSCGDHRIAMSAAIAAVAASEPVVILGAECVEKSYPTFWAEYARLGGQYEQYIR